MLTSNDTGRSVWTRSSGDPIWGWVGTVLVFGCALGLFYAHNRFSLGLHFDEPPKIRAAVQENWNFRHPLLMVETTRLVVRALGVSDLQAAVEVGRTLSASMGAVAVAAMFRLTLLHAGLVPALLVCFAALTTPLLAVHAHYLKEDVWLLPFCVLATIGYSRLAKENMVLQIVLLGIWIGLAISSKAVGIFLIPVLLIAAGLETSAVRGRLVKAVLQASALAIVVVLLVNLRMLFNYEKALKDLLSELAHGTIDGHWDKVVYPIGYHFTSSLAQGVGVPFLIIGILGMFGSFLRWRSSEPIDRLMAIYALTYYGMIEVSPLKAWPDIERYALPLILPLTYFCGRTIAYVRHQLAALPKPALANAVVVWTAAFALLPTAVTGIRLVGELEADTRIVAERLLAGKGLQVITERYGPSVGVQVASIAMDAPRVASPGVRNLVTSSFLYGRFAVGVSVGGSRNKTALEIWSAYEAIFKMPYCEISPRVMSYGMSNPTIRIIDLSAARAPDRSSRLTTSSLPPQCASAP